MYYVFGAYGPREAALSRWPKGIALCFIPLNKRSWHAKMRDDANICEEYIGIFTAPTSIVSGGISYVALSYSG